LGMCVLTSIWGVPPSIGGVNKSLLLATKKSEESSLFGAFSLYKRCLTGSLKKKQTNKS